MNELRPEYHESLAKLAVLMATCAAETFNVHGDKAYVPRALVNEVREIMEQQGIDWRAMCRAKGGPRKQSKIINQGDRHAE